jgi:ribosomal protein S18 acetylase RimI-like enzyme
MADMPEIFKLYQLATDFQKIKFPANQWPKFSGDLIATEIKENRQFKLLIDDQIACVWAITDSDPHIWEGSENDAAIYIHRIATNPDFRGNNFVDAIVNWSKEYADNNYIEFVRMDTCGNNERLINHYENSGFNFLGMKQLKDSSELPSHYHNADVCFFEIKLSPLKTSSNHT